MFTTVWNLLLSPKITVYESTKSIGAVNKASGVKNFENNWEISSTTQKPKISVPVITKG